MIVHSNQLRIRLQAEHKILRGSCIHDSTLQQPHTPTITSQHVHIADIAMNALRTPGGTTLKWKRHLAHVLLALG